MAIQNIAIQPFDGQKPGTSGLRKKTRVFMEPGFLEAFVQSIFVATGGAEGKTYTLGGDGRYFNKQAIQTILKMAAANGAKRVIVGQNGLLSTPASSHLIRLNQTDGGFILSASHNPGGLDEDFGLKFNAANGGPAPEAMTEAMYAVSQTIQSYAISDADDVDLSICHTTALEGMQVDIIDPVADYHALMRELFDFDAIRALFASGFTMVFDAMHAVTGPYAKAIIEGDLGAAPGSVRNAVPLEDFGGGHPDPNPIWAKDLMAAIMGPDAPDFGAASDGDGDRNMITGRGVYVSPSDSLAVLAANATAAPAYAKGLAGIARSMPTSAAADRVADALGIEAFETPTGWKFFGNLLDAGRVTICGEESAGTGSDHVREKDGLWAVLLWLNILAVQRKSVAEVLAAHWQRFGRDYYSRHDYEALEVGKAQAVMEEIRGQLGDLGGKQFCGLTLSHADEFAYEDPIDGSISRNQGLRLYFEGARAVLRLSGTGTQGATLRVYLEIFEPADGDHSQEPQAALAALRDAVRQLGRFEKLLGRLEPDVIT